MRCPFCAAHRTRTFAAWPEYTIMRCDDCHFRFIDTASAGYPANAQFIYDEPRADTLPQPLLPHIRRRVRDILRYTQPPGRALDVGCGRGEVSIALADAGFSSMGVDMKTSTIDTLKREAPQVTWRSTTVEALSLNGEKFDVITLYHVLEHVANAADALRKMLELARPGALLVVEVPNTGGLEARLKGRRWHYYKVDHVNYFRKKHLRALARELELDLLDIRGYQHFSFPQDVWWKDKLKAIAAAVGFQDVVGAFYRCRRVA